MSKGVEDHRPGRLSQAVDARIADDADDLLVRRAVPDTPAQRAASREIPSRGRFVDDGGGRYAALDVAVGEQPAFAQYHSGGREVVGADAVLLTPDHLPDGRLITFDVASSDRLPAAQGAGRGERRIDDAGYGPHALQDARLHRPLLYRCRRELLWRRERDRDKTIAVEARIEIPEVQQAATEQRRRDDEQHRQAYLCGHQRPHHRNA